MRQTVARGPGTLRELACPNLSSPDHAEGDTVATLRARLAEAERRIAGLEEAVAARDHFVAMVGHEMRNPMVPITLAVDRARRMAAAGKAGKLADSLRTLDAAVTDFVRRATQLLDASRFNAGQFRLDPEPTDASALLRSVVTAFAEMARHARCPLHSDVAEGIVPVCDAAALRQVAENLLSNALKYGAGAPVTVALSQAGGYVCLVVRDGGPGIAEADRQRIFERFERIARRGSPGGFGVGLWLVGQLVAAMGGTVTVESVEGQGSTFSVRLPAGDRPETGPLAN